MSDQIDVPTRDESSILERLDRLQRDVTALNSAGGLVSDPRLAWIERIKDGFPGLFLTLISIIQGVVLTTLVETAHARSSQFDAAMVLEIVAMFAMIVIAWHEFALNALSVAWLPTYADAIIPFLFAAVEVVAIEEIGDDTTRWLGAVMLLPLVALLQGANAVWHLRQHMEDRLLPRQLVTSWPQWVGLGAAFLFGAALYAATGKGLISPTSWAPPALVLAGMMATAAALAYSWHSFLNRMAHLRV